MTRDQQQCDCDGPPMVEHRFMLSDPAARLKVDENFHVMERERGKESEAPLVEPAVPARISGLIARRRPQGLTDSATQGFAGEGLLQQHRALLQQPVLEDHIVGIT